MQTISPEKACAKSSRWRPLETAPLDGSEVLLAVKMRAGISQGLLVGHYRQQHSRCLTRQVCPSGWNFWDGSPFDAAAVPTHWSPLPAYPQMGAQAANAEGADSTCWQSMGSAPRDGREVVLAVKPRDRLTPGFVVAHYMGGGHCIEDHPPIDSGWYFWNGHMFDLAPSPSHWLVLPLHPEWDPKGWQARKQGRPVTA